MRITVDFDERSRRKAYGMFGFLRHAFPRSAVEIWLSSNGKYHLIVHNTGLEHAEIMRARLNLGDDYRRISLDSVRKPLKIAHSVLFTHKGHKKAILLARVEPVISWL